MPPQPARAVIWIHPEAPPKPAIGQPCNGCGVCCLAEPCPLGMVVSLKRTGACRALEWSDEGHQYRCGMLTHPARYVGLRTLNPEGLLNRLIRRYARRMIAAGIGCDADIEPQRPSDAPPPAPSPAHRPPEKR
ncbi:hypothetical protein CDN99_02195 [Roseateles aquatilis]|uniref:4Fe-4S ferredoxin-type domain-containing protein n=1 Tax=Roseateles aquatilis TaxID=431061 RepID=A0A246JL10_9BURK|nr:hypothetical protein [Roseateles aquatilis]OWQ93318.1 hypothetical protein CDN99_02195 [Roseateles aquatilis]